MMPRMILFFTGYTPLLLIIDASGDQPTHGPTASLPSAYRAPPRASALDVLAGAGSETVTGCSLSVLGGEGFGSGARTRALSCDQERESPATVGIPVTDDRNRPDH